MQIKRLCVIVILSLGLISLTGCHKAGSKNGVGGDQDQNAQTSGMGDKDGFNDATSANRLKAPYNQTYLFEFDKFDVAQDDIASINVQGNYLIAHSGAKVRLEGNADERGSREYNIALGYKRAKAVAAVLEQQGVPSKQIAIVSYGKEKPVSFGHDEGAWRLNRRVELVYEAK